MKKLITNPAKRIDVRDKISKVKWALKIQMLKNGY